jgi:mono/diheme cytochrome c family protein
MVIETAIEGQMSKDSPRADRTSRDWSDEEELDLAVSRARRGARTFKPLRLLCLTLLFTACQNVPSAEPPPAAIPPPGQALAQAKCGGCHAVGRYGRSSISNAPPFPAIVNQEGVTAETLSFWLRGAHNYPREMDFYLLERDVDGLVAYMLTLRDPNYRRPPD